jgi:hypothetical protein
MRRKCRGTNILAGRAGLRVRRGISGQPDLPIMN